MDIYKKLVGEYVIVRANEAGVLFGKATEITSNTIALDDCRKIYNWKGAYTVEDISKYGINDDSKVTVNVDGMIIANYCQVLPCSSQSYNVIKNIEVWSMH